MPALPEHTAGAEPQAGAHLSLGQECGGQEALPRTWRGGWERTEEAWSQGHGQGHPNPRPVEKQCESSSGPAARSWRGISQPQVSHSHPCLPSAGPLLLLLAQSLHFFSVQLRWPEVPRLIIPKKFRNPKGDGQRQIEKKERTFFGKTMLHLLVINKTF